jgi:DNA transformation protein
MSGEARYRELLADLEPLAFRRMFGGWGIYRGGRMFALVAGDRLYLKADVESVGAFEQAGSEPFVFETKDGRRAVLSYRRLPEDAEDDPQAATGWARLAIEAAARAGAAKRPRENQPELLIDGPWDEAG